MSQIFKPFYRPDFSRQRKDGGTGIGLFIVQQILEKHQFGYTFYAADEKQCALLFNLIPRLSHDIKILTVRNR